MSRFELLSQALLPRSRTDLLWGLVFVGLFLILILFLSILFNEIDKAQAVDCIRPLKTWNWSSS